MQINKVNQILIDIVDKEKTQYSQFSHKFMRIIISTWNSVFNFIMELLKLLSLIYYLPTVEKSGTYE